jgi:hypothetical protein
MEFLWPLIEPSFRVRRDLGIVRLGQFDKAPLGVVRTDVRQSPHALSSKRVRIVVVEITKLQPCSPRQRFNRASIPLFLKEVGQVLVPLVPGQAQ